MKNILLICLFISWVTPVWAGTEVKALLESTSNRYDWVKVDAFIQGSHVRLNFNGPWSRGALIYDRKTSLVTLVDDIHQVVLPISQTMQMALKFMGLMTAGELRNELKSAPPSARLAYRLVEENAQALFDGNSVLDRKNVRMNGFICNLYVAHQDGIKEREVWMTPLGSTSLSRDNYETLLSLTQNMVDLFGNELDELGANTTPFLQDSSNFWFPIKVILYIHGGISSRFQIVQIHQRTLSSDTFEAPRNYQELSLLELIQNGMK